ncbi:MAG: hypothetical protein ACREFQ_08325 [Stellaceae bacterium]
MDAKPVLHTVEGSAEPVAPLRRWWLVLAVASLAGWAVVFLAARFLIRLFV